MKKKLLVMALFLAACAAPVLPADAPTQGVQPTTHPIQIQVTCLQVTPTP